MSHQAGSNSATAVWIWQTVNSGFFPPQLLVDPRKEQVAYGADGQVAFQPRIATPFVVVQSQLVLSDPRNNAPPAIGRRPPARTG